MSSVTTPQGIRVGNAIVEPMRNRITNGRKSKKVTSREMDVLMCLIDADSAVASREELMDSVWTDVIVNDDALTLAISRLRRAFADNPRQPEYIETIPKRGYRLLVPTEQVRGEEIKAGTSRVRRYRIGIAVLVIMLAFVTALFMRVRTEYEKVSDNGLSATNSLVIDPE